MASTRRIVTGHDEHGKAVFLEDGDCPHIQEIMGAVTIDYWQNRQTPADNDDDYFTGGAKLPPPPDGSIFRLVDFSAHGPCVMHRTATLDYGYIISGEVYAILEDEEKLMRAGDAIVQRGTVHGWHNRSGETCRVLFVLVDATPLPGLDIF